VSAAPSPSTSRSDPEVRLRVLIGEDEAASAAALVERVRALGHDPVGPFADGAVALAAALVEPPDAYLLAAGLPGIGGSALAGRLQEHGLRGTVVLLPVEPAALDAALAAAGASHAGRAEVVASFPRRPARLG
jgi:DNA-binding response OmpR family regulator